MDVQSVAHIFALALLGSALALIAGLVMPGSLATSLFFVGSRDGEKVLVFLHLADPPGTPKLRAKEKRYENTPIPHSRGPERAPGQ